MPGFYRWLRHHRIDFIGRTRACTRWMQRIMLMIANRPELDPFEDRHDFRHRQRMASPCRGRAKSRPNRERAALQPLARQPIPRHVPDQDFDHRPVLADEHEGIAAQRILIQLLPNQHGQPIAPLAHVRRRPCQEDPLAMRQTQHGDTIAWTI